LYPAAGYRLGTTPVTPPLHYRFIPKTGLS
jgi:hypothetical protein